MRVLISSPLCLHWCRSSGLVNSLKAKCREEIEQYERCLKANTANASTCTPQLERLWLCSEGQQPNAHVCDANCSC